MNSQSPQNLGYRMPAEWEPHRAVWLAWPSHGNLWQENLPYAQQEFVALCQAIADLDPVSKKPRGEHLNVLTPNENARIEAEKALAGLPVTFFMIPFGDIWLRDTAPLFVTGSEGRAAVTFQFNGWGKKYRLEFDSEVSLRISEATGDRTFHSPLVLEGGSVELDGEGTCLTSRQCLLNDNRNPGMNQAQIEAQLCESLGVQKVLWVGDGLLNDHTDGHIDTIARFIGPGKVLCMKAQSFDDPNREILEKIEQDLRQMIDAKGRKLEVGLIPSPGEILSEDGELMPASYVNFYIANTTVVVPVYGGPHDQAAVAAIAKWFPDRRVIGVPAYAILSGGGAFHCISQQDPA